MTLEFRPVDEATIREFVAWRYAAPYDIYNPDPEEADESVGYFLEPAVNCYGMFDAAGELVAYCTLGADGQVPGGDYGDQALDIGLGVRPDLTGQGRGITYVRAVIDFARRRPSVDPGRIGPDGGARRLRVTIAEFNARAQRVWGRAGFRPVSRFEREPDGMGFVVMVGEERD